LAAATDVAMKIQILFAMLVEAKTVVEWQCHNIQNGAGALVATAC